MEMSGSLRKFSIKIDEIFTMDLKYVVSINSTVNISSIFVAFLENKNFIKVTEFQKITFYHSSRNFIKITFMLVEFQSRKCRHMSQSTAVCGCRT